ncbi:MAG: hypothetical protein K2J99_18335, partial [Lachnospiraceae bacterium]|nr:hypothetical protein [Lachnospiraceae bacterium]
YLVVNYNLPNLKDSNIAAKWDKDYVMYTFYKFIWLKKQTELNSYLMLLSQDKYKIIITINDSSLLKNTAYTPLLENLSVDPDSIQENTKYIIIDCPNNTAKVINNLKPDENETNISLGNLSYVVRQNAQDCDDLPPYSEIYLDGTKIYSSSSSHSESALHITVISTVTKEIIDDVDYQNNDQLFIRN